VCAAEPGDGRQGQGSRDAGNARDDGNRQTSFLLPGQDRQPVLIHRGGTSRKGSLLVFPCVEVKWDAAGELVQDTVLTLSNDYPDNVLVAVCLINGDPPLSAAQAADGRAHRGWNHVRLEMPLTGDEPAFWSAATGLPAGVSPWRGLDPGSPPGRPDPDDPELWSVRGCALLWAIDPLIGEIRWNHLAGTALTIDYALGSAWECDAYAFQVVAEVPDGAAPDAWPGQLSLNDAEYEACFARLQLDFQAVGSFGLSSSTEAVRTSTDLTLLPLLLDLRQDGGGPVVTKARIDVWNMNEVRFSETTRCVTLWDQCLLRDYGIPNHFLRANLHTDRGKARIEGVGSTACPGSVNAPLCGVSVKRLQFPSGTEHAANPVGGQGFAPGGVLYDVTSPPEELINRDRGGR